MTILLAVFQLLRPKIRRLSRVLREGSTGPMLGEDRGTSEHMGA